MIESFKFADTKILPVDTSWRTMAGMMQELKHLRGLIEQYDKERQRAISHCQARIKEIEAWLEKFTADKAKDEIDSPPRILVEKKETIDAPSS